METWAADTWVMLKVMVMNPLKCLHHFKLGAKTQNYTETLEVLRWVSISSHFLSSSKPLSLWSSLLSRSQPSLSKANISSAARGERSRGTFPGEEGSSHCFALHFYFIFFWKASSVSSNRMVTLRLPVLLTPWPGLCKCKCRLWMHVQCLIFRGRILYNWNLSSPGDESKTNLRIKSHRGIIPKGNLL